MPAIKDLINRFEAENYPDIDFQYYEMPDKIDKDDFTVGISYRPRAADK
ncbi:MAG: hypothetical protein IPO94_13780 [Saprospiraceae bacterium]|nr:hypothetical protein [Saprospiraceae bacterium]